MADTRVRREDDAGAIVWRKTYRDGGRRRRTAALRWVARRLGLNALLAPVALTPEDACRTEQAMIRRLAALGAHVPAIVEVGERHLLLSDLGETLAVICKRSGDAQERQRLVALGLDALADLHARGGYLSQAFARNLTLRDGRIGFIDLEEDPATMMSLPAAQARDVLFYAHSTARFLDRLPGAHAQLLATHLQRESAQVRAEVAITVRRLWWLAPLSRPFGARARAVGEALVSLRVAAG